MVKIREGLPLVDGQTTQADSATLAAQLVASQRSHQSANSYAQIPHDISCLLINCILPLIALLSMLTTAMTLTLKMNI